MNEKRKKMERPLTLEELEFGVCLELQRKCPYLLFSNLLFILII
jgi:hypothetical protein